MMDPVRTVEATLFASSHPLRVTEIAELTGVSQTAVRRALKRLAEEYDAWGSSIQVLKTGPSYSLAVRDDYREAASMLSDQELSRGCLKTAAMIAYYQPLLQSELVRMRGPRAYEDVKDLRVTKLIVARSRGQTLELTTSKRFVEYFGIESNDPEVIRSWLESRIK